MLRVQAGPLTGFACLLSLLGALDATVGLSGLGWVVGVACGAGANAALAGGLARQNRNGLGPADHVTLTRAVLGCGVAALTADSFTRPAAVAILVTVSAIALVLDGVDGRVARRTHTASALGARFDMEVDAFLILVLSVYVARPMGWWVLAIGAMRYVFVAAGRVFPRLRESPRPRPWCKVVAAVSGVVLAVAAADVLPDALSRAALAGALILLTESFGRETWELWRPRAQPRREPAELTAAGVVGDG